MRYRLLAALLFALACGDPTPSPKETPPAAAVTAKPEPAPKTTPPPAPKPAEPPPAPESDPALEAELWGKLGERCCESGKKGCKPDLTDLENVPGLEEMIALDAKQKAEVKNPYRDKAGTYCPRHILAIKWIKAKRRGDGSASVHVETSLSEVAPGYETDGEAICEMLLRIVPDGKVKVRDRDTRAFKYCGS
jgi:hypothetical protein